MAIVSEPNEYSVEGIVETDEGNRRVVFTQGINGTQQNYSEMSVECIVEDDSGNKQRCVAVKNFGGGGGGGGTDDYSDLTNKPKINNVTLSGNKTSSDLSLQDALVSGTNIKTINNTSLLGAGDIAITSPVTDVQADGTSILSSGVANMTSTNMAGVVRGVSPACTTIDSADTTATLVANTTYASIVNSAGCVFTIVTPSSSDVYSGFILQLDTTNSASVAFQTDDTPAATISISGNPAIEVGKKYTVTGQWDVLNSNWQLFIISYETT